MLGLLVTEMHNYFQEPCRIIVPASPWPAGRSCSLASPGPVRAASFARAMAAAALPTYLAMSFAVKTTVPVVRSGVAKSYHSSGLLFRNLN